MLEVIMYVYMIGTKDGEIKKIFNEIDEDDGRFEINRKNFIYQIDENWKLRINRNGLTYQINEKNYVLQKKFGNKKWL